VKKVSEISIEQILETLPSDSKLSQRCSIQPAYKESLVKRVRALSEYYRSQSDEALASFNSHLRMFKYDSNQYVSYESELQFASFLLYKHIVHCFLSDSEKRMPDIRVSGDNTTFTCEVASLPEDEIWNAVMFLKKRLSSIPSGRAISLSISSLDRPGKFDSNLKLIAEIETLLVSALAKKDYSAIKTDSFKVEFSEMPNPARSELVFTRTAWEKGPWLQKKLRYILHDKHSQLESCGNTVLVLRNFDPRMMGFEDAIPAALSEPATPCIVGVLLIDPFLVAFYSNPNYLDESHIGKFITDKLTTLVTNDVHGN